MPSKESVKSVNSLLEEQAALTRQLADLDIARLTASDKATDQLRGRLAQVNQSIDDSKKSGGLTSLGTSIDRMAPGLMTLVAGAGALVQGLTRANAESVAMAVSFGRINLADAVKSQEQFENAATRMAAATGSSFAAIQAEVKSVADATGESQDELFAYANATKGVSGGFDAALERARQLSKESRELGITFGEAVSQFGTGMAQLVAVKPGDGMFRSLAAQAEALKTVGGPKAFAEQIAALNGQIKGLDAKGLSEAGAVFGTLTKGLSPERAKEAQAKIAGTIKGRAAEIKQFYGVDVLTSGGELDPSKVAPAIRAVKTKGGQYSERVLGSVLGGGDAQVGRMMNQADLSEIALRRLSTMAPAASPNALEGTAAGRSIAAQRREEKKRREESETVVDAGRRSQERLAGLSSETRDTIETLSSGAARMGVGPKAISQAIGGKGAEQATGIVDVAKGVLLPGNASVALVEKLIQHIQRQPVQIEVQVNNTSDKPVSATAAKKSGSPGRQ